jgi:hypothetical protein
MIKGQLPSKDEIAERALIAIIFVLTLIAIVLHLKL